MFLSDLSIKRPVFSTMMIMALVVLGLFSYRRLSIDAFPDIEFPFLVIQTRYPGASPESVEREVTKKIEEAVNPVQGVTVRFSVPTASLTAASPSSGSGVTNSRPSAAAISDLNRPIVFGSSASRS